MKISTRPRRKLLLCIAVCAAALAVNHNASALSIGDSHELGFLLPSGPSGNQSTYVNHLLGMALGSIDIANGQVYFRSNNAFSPLPTAVQALSGIGTTINLGSVGLYTYLLANYAGFGSEVWYVGDLHGIITIPGLGVGVSLPNGRSLVQVFQEFPRVVSRRCCSVRPSVRSVLPGVT